VSQNFRRSAVDRRPPAFPPILKLVHRRRSHAHAVTGGPTMGGGTGCTMIPRGWSKLRAACSRN